MPRGRASVLLNAPNSVGLLRAALLVAAVFAAAAHAPEAAWWLAAVSLPLDALDGALARAFGQSTAFGAVLDVVIDNATRAWLWSGGLPLGLGAPLISLEATVFAFTHAASGAQWKGAFFTGAPPWARAVMANGLRSPAGAAAVAGLMGCPLWLWARSNLPPGAWQAAPLWGCVLLPCRLLAAAVELWVVWAYLGRLLDADAADGSGGQAAAGAAAAAAAGGGVAAPNAAGRGGRQRGGTS